MFRATDCSPKNFSRLRESFQSSSQRLLKNRFFAGTHVDIEHDKYLAPCDLQETCIVTCYDRSKHIKATFGLPLALC